MWAGRGTTDHEFLATDALREARVVLDIRRGGQLASCCYAIGEHALIEHS